jgi:hypothetical protein
MPNECINHVTITFPSEIKEELESDIKKMQIVITQTGKNGVRFHITTAWIPDNAWLESLTKKYPSCWIKNEWISEDGTAGVWVAYKNDIKFMEWEDLSIEDEHYMFHSM